MVLLLRFFKVYFAKSKIYYCRNETGVNCFQNIGQSLKILTRFEFAKSTLYSDYTVWNICRRFENFKSSLHTRADEQVLPSRFETMKSLTKKVVAIISKVKKKKKSRRKKISKKTMEASLTGECSQFSSTVCSSDPTVPKSSTDASSSPVTMALSYRDALVKPETSVLSAEGKCNTHSIVKLN